MAKELKYITPHPSGSGFDLPFSTGTVSVPDLPGGYCISSGCGSGKTESIKNLIRQKYNDGILYCVDTIRECQKMYEWVKTELVGRELQENDVIMINSKSAFEQMELYRKEPEALTEKKVIIVVQVRFFVELIHLFLLYQTPKSIIHEFNGDFSSLMKRNDLRKYILFDETPLFLKPFQILSKGELAPFAIPTSKGWRVKSLTEMKKTYSSFIQGDRKTDYNPGESRLDELKNQTVLQMIHRLFNSWMAEREPGTYKIQFYPSDLIQPCMNCHVIIFEGAGDILLGQKSKFKLLDLKEKYRSKASFSQFPFKLSRKVLPRDKDYKDFVDSIRNILSKCPGKTLVVIWKDFRGTGLNDTDDYTYTSKLKEALIEAGIDDQNSFSVTYYGASDTKSTNDYREYRNIILCGKWWLGNSTVQKLRRGFSIQDVCMENYMLWYYVQLLLRIGLRNNDGFQCQVFYSSDHDSGFINRLDQYINKNNLIPKKIKPGQPLWEIIVGGQKMGKHYLPDLRSLVSFDPCLLEAIESGQAYTIRIGLSEIAKRIPKKKKPQRDNYRGLISFLSKIMITLEIVV
jgi:hypothetical protein